jgi:hypothetical protein
MVRKSLAAASIQRDIGVSKRLLSFVRDEQIEELGTHFGKFFERRMPVSKEVSEDRSESKALTILLAIALMNVVEGSEKDELSVYLNVLLADSEFTDQNCYSFQCLAVMLFGISVDQVSRVNYNCDGSI